MTTLTPSQIATLCNVNNLFGFKTSAQAAALDLTPMAFGNFMKGLVKAGMVAKTPIEGGFSYLLTDEGRTFLPAEPVLPGFAYEARVAELETEGCTTSDAQGIADMEQIEAAVANYREQDDSTGAEKEEEEEPSASPETPIVEASAPVVTSAAKKPVAFASTVYVSIYRLEEGFRISSKKKDPSACGLVSRDYSFEELSPAMTPGLRLNAQKLIPGQAIAGFLPPSLIQA